MKGSIALTTTFSRVALTSLAVAATTLSLSTAANAQSSDYGTFEKPLDARECVDAGNVWVYVEYGADVDKEPEGACATEFTDGVVALESAGFVLTWEEFPFGKMMTGINGVVPVWEETETYWVYSTGEVADDYSVTYEYNSDGASDAHPEPGTVEAWVVGTGAETPALEVLPETPAPGSSENGGWIAAIAGLLALIGGGIAALFQGLITIPGLVLPQF
nr:hypothetical protein [Corynebacterium suranareeae]